LHLVGYLYYWQMGFNSVFKGLRVTSWRRSDRDHSRVLRRGLKWFSSDIREKLWETTYY